MSYRQECGEYFSGGAVKLTMCLAVITEQNRTTLLPQAKVLMAGCHNSQHGHQLAVHNDITNTTYIRLRVLSRIQFQGV